MRVGTSYSVTQYDYVCEMSANGSLINGLKGSLEISGTSI